MSDRLRLVLVDDQQVVRDSIKVALSCDPGIEVVGEAASGAEAVRVVSELVPDIVLLDLRMPTMDGLSVLEVVHREHPEVKVLVLTILGERECVREAFNLGAVGYVVKGEGRMPLVDIVRHVAEGRPFVHPAVRLALLKQLELTGTDGLDEASMELLMLVASGLTDEAIAARLGLDSVVASDRVLSLFDSLDYREPVQELAAMLRSELAS